MRTLFERTDGEATAGDKIPPPPTIGERTSGQTTRGERIKGLRT